MQQQHKTYAAYGSSCPEGCQACVNNYGSSGSYCNTPDCIPVYYGTPCDACESSPFNCSVDDCQQNAGCQDADKWWANVFNSIFGGGTTAVACTDQFTPTQLRAMIGSGLADQGYIHVCTDQGRVPNCSFSDADFAKFMADKPPAKSNYVLINKDTVQIPSCHSTIGDSSTYLQSGPVANIRGQGPPGYPPYNIVTAYVWNVLPIDNRSVYLDTNTNIFWKFKPLLYQIDAMSYLPSIIVGEKQCSQQLVDLTRQPDYVNTTGTLLDTIGWAYLTYGMGINVAILHSDKNPYGWPQFSGFIVRPDGPFSLGGPPWSPNPDVDTYTFQPYVFKTFATDGTVSGIWYQITNPQF